MTRCGVVCDLGIATEINKSIGEALRKKETLCQKCGIQTPVIRHSETFFCGKYQKVGRKPLIFGLENYALKFNFNIILVKLILKSAVKISKTKVDFIYKGRK